MSPWALQQQSSGRICNGIPRNEDFYCSSPNTFFSKSLNGVFVNKEPLTPGVRHLLQENDVIHLGPPQITEFQYRYFTLVLSSNDDEEFLKPCKIRSKDEEKVPNAGMQDTCFKKDHKKENYPSVYLQTNDSIECLPQDKETGKYNVHGATPPTSANITETSSPIQTYPDVQNPQEKELESFSLPEDKDLHQKLAKMQKLLAEKEKSEQELQIKLKEKEAELQKCHKEQKEVLFSEKEKKIMGKDDMLAAEQKLRKCLETQIQELLHEKVQVEMKMKNLSKADKETQNVLQKEREWLQSELTKKENQAKQLEDQLQCAEKKEELIRLEVIKHFGELMETELTCVICSELFIEATALNCSHTFCAQCISQWKKKKKDCPICRAKIKCETRALVMDNFIDKMVQSLTPDLQSRRKTILVERKGNKQSNEKSGSSSTSSESNSLFPVPVVVIGDSDFDTSDFEDDSDSSLEGDPWAYYGGYGSCFHCGRRGHWANGCPDRY